MATYGEYETFEEHHSGARSAVWKARRRGSAAGEVFAVKVCQATHLLEEEEGTAPATGSFATFCAAAEEQRVLAGRRERHWMNVLAIGRTESEAYWVGPFYARSLERLLEGRAELQAPDLHWLVTAIVRGLLDLDAELHRPHGNLKPSNVFISSADRLRDAQLVLADLKPRAETAIPGDRTADFQALGRIIVNLARRRADDTRGNLGWPFEQGPEWKRLGRHGEGWRKLCNSLLAPNPTGFDLTALAAELEPLGKKGVRVKTIVAAATMSTLAAVGGVVYLRTAEYARLPDFLKGWAERIGNKGQVVHEMPKEWTELCDANYEWVTKFEDDLGDPGVRATLAKLDYLRTNVLEVLDAARTKHGSLSASKLVGSTAGPQAVKGSPPQSAMNEATIGHIVEVANAVAHAGAAITAWPETKRGETAVDTFTQLGWTRPATEVKRLLNVQLKGTLAENLVQIAQLAPTVNAVQGQWNEVLRQQRDLGAGADAVLARAPDHYRTRLAEATSLADLQKQMGDFARDYKRLTDATRDPARVDYDRFRRESFVANFAGPVDADALQRWETELRDYTAVSAAENPWQKPEFASAQRRIEEGIAALRDEDRVGADGFRNELQGKRGQLDALRATRLVRKDISIRTRDAEAKLLEWSDLEGRVKAAVADAKPDPGKWLAEVTAVTFGAPGSVLQREWNRRREGVTGGATAASLGRSPAEFQSKRRSVGQLRTYFTGLAGERGVGALQVFDAKGIPDSIARDLAGEATARTDRAIEQLAGLIPDSPAAGGEDLFASPRWREVIDRHAGQLRSLAEIGRELSTLDENLSQGADAAQVEGVLSRLRSRAEFAAVEKLAAVQAALGDVNEIARLRTETRVETLTAAARTPRLALALTGWRRLGALAGWPNAANLQTEMEIAGELLARIDRDVRDAGRRQALREELAREGPRRWRAALRSAQDDTAVGVVLGLREKFAVAEESLSGRERFNVLLHQLKQVDWRGLDESDSIRRRGDAVARLREYAGSGAGAETSAWLASLSDIPLADQGGASDLSKLGPGAVGWTGVLSRDGRSVTYRWRSAAQEHELVFLWVESERVPPFFLCTSEFSVGLLLDLMAQPKVSQALLPMLTKIAYDAGEDNRTGPRLWRVEPRRGLRLTSDWIGATQPTWPKPFYPADLPDVGAPTRNHPAQYLPPKAALFLAEEVLGCRLPSPDEWPDIVALAKRSAEGANVRDTTWRREKDFLTSRGVQGSPLDGDLAWPSSLGARRRGGDAQAVAPERNDGVLWFAEVGAGGTSFHNLFGNVAEYLYDGKKFMFAGGSALSPPEIDPATCYPVEDAFATNGFADVGLRLALNAPGRLTGLHQVQLMIRKQPYLRL